MDPNATVPSPPRAGVRVNVVPTNTTGTLALSLPAGEGGSGTTIGYFAKAKNNFPYVDRLEVEEATCAFEGTHEEFLKKYDNPSLNARGKNKIRKCPHCSKVVAFTLPTCNGCGMDLTREPISYSNNIFIGFLYGIQRGPFPFTVSMRKQTSTYMVFDDLLALCPCHLNVIPTTQYLPDWRYLLRNPVEGLKIARDLFDNSWEAVTSHFLSNKEWYKKTIKTQLSNEELKGHIAAGFNYPPSQFQLHLQFMLPPFIPFHYFQYLNGVHFTKNRFFPFEYVVQLLQLNQPYDVQELTPVEEIIAFYDKHVSYDKIWNQCYAKYGASHDALSNWSKDDFEGFVLDNKFFKWKEEAGGESGGADAKAAPAATAGGVLEGVEDVEQEVKGLSERDKLVLQNYGRPYKGGRPSGTYYKFAKKVEDDDVKVW